MFKIIVLGEISPIPTDIFSLPSIFVRYEGRKEFFNILLDCGEGTQSKMYKNRISHLSIDFIFISHSHLDHFSGLFGLLTSMNILGREKSLTIFIPKESKDYFNKIFELFKLDFPIEIKYITENKFYETEELEFYGIKTYHTEDSYSILIKQKDYLKYDKNKIEALTLSSKDIIELKEKGKIEKNNKMITIEDITYKKEGEKLLYSGDIPNNVYLYKELEKLGIKRIDYLIYECSYEDEKLAEERKHSTIKKAQIEAEKLKSKLICFHYNIRIIKKYIQEFQSL